MPGTQSPHLEHHPPKPWLLLSHILRAPLQLSMKCCHSCHSLVYGAWAPENAGRKPAQFIKPGSYKVTPNARLGRGACQCFSVRLGLPQFQGENKEELRQGQLSVVGHDWKLPKDKDCHSLLHPFGREVEQLFSSIY